LKDNEIQKQADLMEAKTGPDCRISILGFYYHRKTALIDYFLSQFVS